MIKRTSECIRATVPDPFHNLFRRNRYTGKSCRDKQPEKKTKLQLTYVLLSTDSGEFTLSLSKNMKTNHAAPVRCRESAHSRTRSYQVLRKRTQFSTDFSNSLYMSRFYVIQPSSLGFVKFYCNRGQIQTSLQVNGKLHISCLGSRFFWCLELSCKQYFKFSYSDTCRASTFMGGFVNSLAADQSPRRRL